DETVIVQAESATVDDAAYREHVERVTADLRGMEGIVEPETVTNFYELSANPETAEMAAGLVSEDRRTTLIPVTLTGTQDEATATASRYRERLEALNGNGYYVAARGYISIGEEHNVIAEEDLIRGEAFGIGAALVILVAVFAALVAAGMPILLAIVAIG